MERYRITEEAGLYFVTFTVVEWLPIFINDTTLQLLADSLNYCIEQKALRVNAFVFMPTHMHANVFDKDFDSIRLNRTLDDFRKFTANQLLSYCAQHAPSSFEAVFRQYAGADRLRRFWQPTKHPEAILSERFWEQKVEYIHQNPCQKGLVRNPEDWRYSSAAYWIKGEEVDVKISDIEW